MKWKVKGTATACLLAVIVLTDPASVRSQSGPVSHFPFARAQYGCAPTDAIALNFYFTGSKGECGRYTEPYLQISIWQNLPKSAPYSINLGNSLGTAIRCLRSGACEAAISGTLSLHKFIDSTTASGEYELHFKDGSVEKGSFDAAWCLVKFVCG